MSESGAAGMATRGEEALAAAYAEAAAQLRAADRELFLLALVAPLPVRPALFALFAFFAEIALIGRRSGEALPGEIRLQWWAEVLSGERAQDAAASPLAIALADAITRANLPVAPFQAMIEARRFDLYNDPMSDWPTCETYCAETYAALIRLQGLVLGGAISGEIAGHLGMAYGLSRLLRSFAGDAARTRLFLPRAVFEHHGVALADVFDGRQTPGLARALTEIVNRACDHAEAAAGALHGAGRAGRRGAGALVLARIALARFSPQEAFALPAAPADVLTLARLLLFQSFGLAR